MAMAVVLSSVAHGYRLLLCNDIHGFMVEIILLK